MNLQSQIEAILFWKAEPVPLKKIMSILDTGESDTRAALKTLSESFSGRGLTLIELDDEFTLGTAKECSGLIEKLSKEELMKDLGKAGLETLSIVLYQGPIARSEIDYIRGVNSQFILRNLLVRGLIQKVENPTDHRSFLYKPTLELLAHLGLSSISALPDYETVRKNIETFKNAAAQENADKVGGGAGETGEAGEIGETAAVNTAEEKSEISQN